MEGGVFFEFEQEADAGGGGGGVEGVVEGGGEEDLQGERAAEGVKGEGGCWEDRDGAREDVAGDGRGVHYLTGGFLEDCVEGLVVVRF